MRRITQDDENMLPKVRNALCLRQKQKGELYMAEYFVCKKNEPVVQTRQGKIRGYRLNTTFTFHGIPYAQAKRFQSPEPGNAVGRSPRRAGIRICVSAAASRMRQAMNCLSVIATGRRMKTARI